MTKPKIWVLTDESKKSGPKKNPTLFKKIATGLRDDLRRSYDFPINLI